MSEKIWIFESSLSPWLVVNYPLNIIKLRCLCAKWIIPRKDYYPSWTPKEYKNNTKNEALLKCLNNREPDFRNSCYCLKLVYEKEGVKALYKGLFMHIMHQTTRDIFLFSFLRSFHASLATYCDYVYDNFQNKFQNNKSIVKKTPDEDIEASTDKPYKSPYYSERDMSHIIIILLVESLVYPLLVIRNRMIAYEGTQSLNSLQMTELTYKLDGFQNGLYAGYIPYICTKFVSNMSSYMTKKLADSQYIRKDLAPYVVAGSAEMVDFLLDPFDHLYYLQSLKTEIPGLCKENAEFDNMFQNFSVNTTISSAGFITCSQFLKLAMSKIARIAINKTSINGNSEAASI